MKLRRWEVRVISDDDQLIDVIRCWTKAGAERLASRFEDYHGSGVAVVRVD